MFTLMKSTRGVFIGVLLAIAVAMLALTALIYLFPGYEQSKKTQLEATSTATIDYSVLMDENPVYENTVVKDEKYYLKPFTGYIDIECTLDIMLDTVADIECSHQVYALLISEISVEDGKDIVWEKRYSYSKLQEETITGTQMNVSRQLYVDLEDYDELTTLLMNSYNILTDYYLRVVFESDIKISANQRSKTQKVITFIDIPFTDTVMEIKGNSPVYSKILIETDVENKKTPNSDLGFLFIALFIASFISLLIVLLRTKGVQKHDKYKLEIEKIFKEYGNRLAGLTDTLSYQSSIMISIDKIEDMVKIADEIGQTIFYYEVDEVDERKIEFYVFDEGRIYYLVMFGTLRDELSYK